LGVRTPQWWRPWFQQIPFIWGLNLGWGGSVVCSTISGMRQDRTCHIIGDRKPHEHRSVQTSTTLNDVERSKRMVPASQVTKICWSATFGLCYLLQSAASCIAERCICYSKSVNQYICHAEIHVVYRVQTIDRMRKISRVSGKEIW